MTVRTLRFFGYGAIALLAIAGATIVSLPASLVAALLAGAAEGRVTFANVTGTAWRGRGDVTVVLGGPPILIPALEWKVHPIGLLAGELRAELRFAGADLRGQATVAQGFHATDLRDVDVTLPAEWIAQRMPLLAAWGVTGMVAIKASTATLSDTRIIADGEIVVRNASAARLGALGDYRVTTAPAGDKTAYRITTLGGPLQVNGAGEIGAHGDFRLNGAVATDAANHARLGPFLSMLGPRRADGTIGIQWPLFGAPQPARSSPGAPRPGTSAGEPAFARGRVHG